jgi:hypothetical protein
VGAEAQEIEAVILQQLIGGAAGLMVGYVFLSWLPGLWHRRRCLRDWEAFIAEERAKGPYFRLSTSWRRERGDRSHDITR